jgi:hypothetical protein
MNFNRQHGDISQKTELFITAAVKTSDPTKNFKKVDTIDGFHHVFENFVLLIMMKLYNEKLGIF